MEEAPKTRQELWDETIQRVSERQDNVGQEMDPGIIETVAALNLLGFPTSMSCEGHLDIHRSTPWVDIKASDKPAEKWQGEAALRLRLAEQYGVPADEIGWGDHQEADEAFFAVIDEFGEEKLTPEFVEWTKRNRAYARQAQALGDEFNAERHDNPEEALRFKEFHDVSGRIIAGPWIPPNKPEQETGLAERLAKRQAVMAAFTEFLKQKFFSS